MQEIRSSGGLEHHYSIKIINPLDRGGYEVHSMDSHVIFNQVSDLNQAIDSSCEEYIQKDKGVKFGYVVPGHGKKGKQIEITSKKDLEEMYKIYKKRREILLWMKQSRKCPKLKVATSSSGLSGGRPSVSKQSKYEEQVDKMAKLEEKYLAN